MNYRPTGFILKIVKWNRRSAHDQDMHSFPFSSQSFPLPYAKPVLFVRHNQYKAMNRLVQGDVGSGKTILAFLALLMCVSNGYQGAMMAPTEVLAGSYYTIFNRKPVGR